MFGVWRGVVAAHGVDSVLNVAELVYLRLWCGSVEG